MSKNNLFKELDVSNKVSRNGFNLSKKSYFTAKCGELLPVYHKSVLPGDKFRMSVNSFTRTAPVETAAYTQFKEYYDWFFIPYRILGKQIPQILAKNTNNPNIASSSTTNQPVASKLPHVTMNDIFGVDPSFGPRYLYTLSNFTNEFGFNRGYLSAKLLNYLGYNYTLNSSLKQLFENGNYIIPFKDNLEVSILPLMAYQKIYYDFYRNSQWEDNVPYNYNVDYMGSNMKFYVETLQSGGSFSSYFDNPTLFDLRYANYPRDLFMGLLPNSQYGDAAVMDVEYNESNKFVSLETSKGEKVVVGSGDHPDPQDHSIRGVNNSDLSYNSSLGINLSSGLSALQGHISVLDERKARSLQKMKEILGSGDLDYQTIIRKIFNVDVPDTLADHCIYLGGSTSVIKINEVENTNLTGDNQANLKGKGVGSGDGKMIDFESDEFGIIMCIYHCCPIIDYALTAMDFDVVKTSADDYPNPLFDNLGFVEFPRYFLSNSNTRGDIGSNFLGYTTRYFDAKTSIDTMLGDFRETLVNWTSPLNEQFLLDRFDEPFDKIDYTFFKINPRIVDTIFGVNADDKVTTDTFRISAIFNVNAVRNLNYLGVPY